MRRNLGGLLLSIFLTLLAGSAFAQSGCNGQFANNTFCGRTAGTTGLPGPTTIPSGALTGIEALSVLGNATNATAAPSAIAAASDSQILRRSGTSIGFGSIDIGQSNAVGSSILLGANGGTGVANSGLTITLGGNIITAGALTTSGAFSSTFTMTGTTSVTFPTSGTLATTSGPSLPSVILGDLLYGSAADVLSALPGNTTTAKQYLSQTGTGSASAVPAWAQPAASDLSNGTSGSGAVALVHAPTFTGSPTVQTASGAARFTLDPTTASTQANIYFNQSGSNIWQFTKHTDQSWILYDNVAGRSAIQAFSNGDFTLMPTAGNVAVGQSTVFAGDKITINGRVGTNVTLTTGAKVQARYFPMNINGTIVNVLTD